MSDIYVERIETAKYAIELYLDKPLPVLPQGVLTSQQRHILICDQREWKEISDELQTQVDEIKTARALYNQEISTLHGEEKTEFQRQFRTSVNATDLQNFLRRANQKLSNIRMLKSNIDRLLQDGPGGTARRNLALPKLSLKEFDGRNWDDFWPLFESTIHADTDLDYVQKMSYLDSLLRGEAKKVIQGLLPFSRENYELSVSLLKDKYGKNENLIRDLHNQLARLQISKSIGDDMKLQLELERLQYHPKGQALVQDEHRLEKSAHHGRRKVDEENRIRQALVRAEAEVHRDFHASFVPENILSWIVINLVQL
ncbi:hypothetical protein niasHS_009921 [Heterodera schachtii]|uniref:Uncharacterized protein n=1 Tax=Heterodera schachtii TaxID=97005 RepID=A0ABD2JCY5_HETSC